MRYIADFHIHSRYSRATSRSLDLPNLDKWSRIKGIDVLATGDFTHPKWRQELGENLEPAEQGLFVLKKELRIVDELTKDKQDRQIRFLFGTELSCIYSERGRVYRNHILVLAPSFAAVDKIIAALEKRGCNLRADGRPILGISSRDLTALVFEADENCMVVPAHAWTPWFSMFGSKSGGDTIAEVFGDQAKNIFALETGLSSDPLMNWRVSGLDKVALLSNSDAHSPEKLGREANVFELQKISYGEIMDAIRKNDPARLKFTIEFFPEEGKYHLDGHRDCKVALEPKETIRRREICPKCGRKLTVGVMHRVEKLADRTEAEARNIGRIPYKSIVPLPEIIADAYGVMPASKKVKTTYEKFVRAYRSEFDILLDVPYDELAKIGEPMIAEGIKRVREGKVEKQAGYDGVYGVVRVFSAEEREGKKQGSLF